MLPCAFTGLKGSLQLSNPQLLHLQPLALINAAALLPSSFRHHVPSAFRSSIARPTGTSVYTSGGISRCPCKTQSQDGFAVLLFCKALSSPTTCPGLSRPTPDGQTSDGESAKFPLT